MGGGKLPPPFGEQTMIEPTNPDYINHLIISLQRRASIYQREIQTLQGKISGINDVLRQIKEDTERALSIASADPLLDAMKQAEKEGFNQYEQKDKYRLEEKEVSQKNPLEGVEVRPKVVKKKGPSIIEKLAPPIEDEKPKKPKKKPSKRKNRG